MGSFGSAMEIVESFVDKFEESLRKKKAISRVVETRYKIFENFEKSKKKPIEIIAFQRIYEGATETFNNN